MRHLISVILAGVLLLGAATVEAFDCPKGYTATQCRELAARVELFKQLSLEDSIEHDRRDREAKLKILNQQLESIRPVVVIGSIIIAIVALVMDFGFIGAAGFFVLGIFGFGFVLLPVLLGVPLKNIDGGPAALLFAAGACIAIIFGVWNRNRTRKDFLFKANVEEMFYSRHDLTVSVNKEKRQVVVNGIEIPPAEFSYDTSEISKTVTTNTGGTQTVYGSGGAVGTVYVPGTSGSYKKVTGVKVTISRSGKEVITVKFSTWRMRNLVSLGELGKVLEKVQAWCDEQKKDSALNALDALCQQADMESDCFKKSFWDEQGVLQWAIAADRKGKAVAVYNNGAETWSGSLIGASAQIVDNKLEIKVNDSAYREKNLSDRVFIVLIKESRNTLVEWESRINLLAKNAEASA
ncbi:MAG: hypothetical protein C0406_06630 [Sideroxydans sp.]|nr:hypothetical protein [Sideroxydans sp.]